MAKTAQRGGSLGSIIKQALVPFTLLALNKKYGKKKSKTVRKSKTVKRRSSNKKRSTRRRR